MKRNAYLIFLFQLFLLLSVVGIVGFILFSALIIGVDLLITGININNTVQILTGSSITVVVVSILVLIFKKLITLH